MKLVRARVQNYRSIVDSGMVSIEESVTVVIGRNEQGKTNFMKGLAAFNPKQRVLPRDFPNHLRPILDDRASAEIPLVTLWLVPEANERPQLEKLLKPEHVAQMYRATRYFDGHYVYQAEAEHSAGGALEFAPPDISSSVESLKAEASSLQARLNAHATRTEAFAPALEQLTRHVETLVSSTFSSASDLGNIVETFGSALSSLPGQDPPIQEEIAAALTKIKTHQGTIAAALAADRMAVFANLIPTFVFHSSSEDRIPDSITVAAFVSDAEKASRGMANLCRIAGLSIQKIQELAASKDASHRETYEDQYSAAISGGINEFWTQSEYHVHFRIEQEKLSVSISDGTYSRRIPPSQRSDGFQWYLSFYSTLLSESSQVAPTVLLLDNPGLELHADGQRDIKRFLEEKLPRTAQVIYVTHSPAMIDTFNLEQVRIARRVLETGTKIENWAVKGDDESDLLEPIRSAIGASLVTSLMFSEMNVLTEGAADKPILEGAFMTLHKADAKRILVNGSISETPAGFLPKFYKRAGLPFVVLVDADDAGRKLLRDLESWGIPISQVVELGKRVTQIEGRDFELEDVLSADFYHLAVSETYPEKQVEMPVENRRKRTKVYESIFTERYGVGFNKRRVGATVKRLLLSGRGDNETLESLRQVTAGLLESLAAQTTVRAPARQPI